MSSFELNKLQAVTGLRALGETDRSMPDLKVASRASADGSTGAAGVKLEIGSAIEPAAPPVDTDRVVEVREALRKGTYPLVPAQIADAMIAAQLRPAIGE